MLVELHERSMLLQHVFQVQTQDKVRVQEFIDAQMRPLVANRWQFDSARAEAKFNTQEREAMGSRALIETARHAQVR